MHKLLKLQEGEYYHVFNRGNNRENIFLDEVDYANFMEKYYYYCDQALETYAYCLMRNHFHFLIRVRTMDEQRRMLDPFFRYDPENLPYKIAPYQLSNLFNSHAQTINWRENRIGSLFQKPFRRKRVDSIVYFITVVCYIHWNPQLHGVCDDFRYYPYSSFGELCNKDVSMLSRAEVLENFGGSNEFRSLHEGIFHTRP